MNRCAAKFASKATLLALAASLWGIAPVASLAQKGPYIFTYGGQLLSTTGEPLKGPVNLELKFYRTASGGDPLPISPISKSGVELTSDGVFQLDVENLADAEMHLVFDGSKATWVEVVANGRAYPRQKLVAVPFALKVPVDGKSIRFDGNGRLAVGPSAAPASGQFLTRNSAGEWVWDSPPSGSGGSTSNAMSKATYDANDNAIVDNAEKLGGYAPSYFLNGANIGAGTIGASQLQGSSVESSKLQSGAVTSDKIVSGAVTSDKLQDGAISSVKLQIGAVTSDKLQDGAVSSVKLQDGAVSSTKIQSGAVTTDHLSITGYPAYGHVLSYSGTGLMWSTPNLPASPVGSPGELQWNGGGYFTASPDLKWNTGSNSLYVGTKIGIGTLSPQAKLDVNGGIKVGDDLSSCSPSYKGTLRQSATNNALQFCDGTTWQYVAAGSSPSNRTRHVAFRFNFNTCSTISSADPSFNLTGSQGAQFCQINFSEPFSSEPICTCSVQPPSFTSGADVHSCLITNVTASSLKIYALSGQTSTASTHAVNVTCIARP